MELAVNDLGDDTREPAKPPARAPQRRWLKLALKFLFAYLVTVVLIATLQRSLIYLPDRAERIYLPQLGEQAADCEHVTVVADDGVTLNGWHAQPSGTRRATVLYFPGNAGNRGYREGWLDALREQGADVFLFDYRGYGENEGSPSEEAIAIDAQAIWRELTGARGIDPQEIVLYGESLGGGVAVRLAEELSLAHSPPGGLVLVATFSSAVDVGRRQFPWLPVGLLMIDRFPSADRIGQVTCPVLQLHGTHDRLVPVALGRKLFESTPEQSATGVPKQFVPIPESGHNDILSTGRETWSHALGQFLAEIDKVR